MERVREWIYKLNSMDSILLNRIEVLEQTPKTTKLTPPNL